MRLDLKELVARNQEYISKAAKEASDYYTRHKVTLEPFPGCVTHLSQEDCRQIYIDLLKEMVTRRVPFATQHGMFVIARVLSDEQQPHFQIRFGLIF
jgi:hypothetical protein